MLLVVQKRVVTLPKPSKYQRPVATVSSDALKRQWDYVSPSVVEVGDNVPGIGVIKAKYRADGRTTLSGPTTSQTYHDSIKLYAFAQYVKPEETDGEDK